MPLALKKQVKWKDESTNRWMTVTPTFEQQGDFLKVNVSAVKMPNISSHNLVNLLGQNAYCSVGAAILSVFGFLEKETLDMYQVKKGSLGEYFATYFIKELYGDRINLESYELSMFEGFNQFKHEPPFSGVLDKMIVAPMVLPIEIKAKELGAFYKITGCQYDPEDLPPPNSGKPQADHALQAKNQAFFVKAKQCMLLYVFLSDVASEMLQAYLQDPELSEKFDEGIKTQSKEIIEDVLGFTRDMFAFHYFILDVNNNEIINYRNRAKKIYDAFIVDHRIPKTYFLADEWQQFK